MITQHENTIENTPALDAMEIFVNNKFKKPAMANMMLYEGCGEEGPIRSIFFAEFHPTLGPRMRYQAPIKPPNRKDHVDKDFFDAISHYLIPKPELARRHLTLNVNGKKICGYSIIIDDSKYPRNQLMFNMCFVCYPWSRTVQFEPAIRKFSEYLVMLEKENEFVSKEEHTEKLKELMEEVFFQLNDRHNAIVQVGRYTLNLKVVPNKPDPPPIHDWSVPVLLIDRDLGKEEWDLTTKEIYPFIDGKHYVKRIACLSNVKVDLVKVCIRNLVYHRVVQCLDGIFMYSNEYVATSDASLFTLKNIRSECIKFLYFINNEDKSTEILEKTKRYKDLREENIFKLLTFFKKGKTCKDAMIKYRPAKSFGYDLYQFVSYFNLRGLLRRVHCYPFHFRNDNSFHEKSGDEKHYLNEQTFKYLTIDSKEIERNELYRWFDGHHHFDEICLRTGIMDQMELQKICEGDPEIVIIRR